MCPHVHDHICRQTAIHCINRCCLSLLDLDASHRMFSRERHGLCDYFYHGVISMDLVFSTIPFKTSPEGYIYSIRVYIIIARKAIDCTDCSMKLWCNSNRVYIQATRQCSKCSFCVHRQRHIEPTQSLLCTCVHRVIICEKPEKSVLQHTYVYVRTYIRTQIQCHTYIRTLVPQYLYYGGPLVSKFKTSVCLFKITKVIQDDQKINSRLRKSFKMTKK